MHYKKKRPVPSHDRWIQSVVEMFAEITTRPDLLQSKCERLSTLRPTSFLATLIKWDPFFFNTFTHPLSWLNGSELQQDWCNGPRAAASSNGRHIWLMSALCCSPGESSRLSLGLLRAEKTPFTALMMIDAVGSQLFLSGLHPSWSLTSGISEMNDLPLMEIRESACRGVKKGGEKKNIASRRKQQLSSECYNSSASFSMFVIPVMLLSPPWLVRLWVDFVLR